MSRLRDTVAGLCASLLRSFLRLFLYGTTPMLFIAPIALSENTTLYDLIIDHGSIVDGLGNPALAADLGIKNGRITTIGDLSKASSPRRINARGLVVAPGFIDVHSHIDRAFYQPQAAASEGYLRQGVTLSVIGGDGYLALEDLRQFRAYAEQKLIGVNFMFLAGHNAVRRSVMGMEQRAPNAAELAAMKSQIRNAMELGATGLSSGLMYLPGNYASSREMTELARVVEPFGGVYDSHVRDPVNDLVASHRECLDTARAAGVAAHPAHIKAVGSKNFGKGPVLVALLQSRIDSGEDITTDLYPYDGASTRPVWELLLPGDDATGVELRQRMTLLKLSGHKGSPAEKKLVKDLRSYWATFRADDSTLANAQRYNEKPPAGQYSWIATVGYGSLRIVVSDQKGYEGRIVRDLAEELGDHPFELLRRILVSEGDTAMVTLGAIQEEDLRILMKQPWAMIASDGEELNPSHPRGRGTFARVLGRYVREWGVLSLEEAVHKMSGLPASYLRLTDRGVLREGAIADITIFDPRTVVDEATWSDPGKHARGVHHVLLGGEFALRDGVLNSDRHGQFVPFRGQGLEPSAMP